MMNHFIELPIRQLSIVNYYSSFATGVLFLAICVVSAEVSSGAYDASKALKERQDQLNRICSKFDDDLKYEYQALHGMPKNDIYQTGKSEKMHYDHVNKWMYCTNGAWDHVHMNRLKGVSMYLNYNNDTIEHLGSLSSMPISDFNDVLKDYNRIMVVENPFLKFVDYYQHYFVNTPQANERYSKDVITYWLNHRVDKLSKDKARTEGEKYFEISDLEEGILTFRQFINFIVKASEEIAMGKKLVSDSTGFTLRWEPMWKHCTPCVKDYRFQHIVDLAHIDEDLDHIMHNVLDIRNATDSTPLKIESFADNISSFDKYNENNYGAWVYHGYAKDHMKIVEKFYSTLFKSEIRGLYEKYRLDFELFGYKPDEFLEMGMNDDTTPSYDP